MYRPSPDSEIGHGVEGLRIDFPILQESFGIEGVGIRVIFFVS